MENEYVCPNCGGIVIQGQNKCESCGTILEWGQENNQSFSSASTIYSNEYRIRKMSIWVGFKTFLGEIVNMFSGRARRKEYWGTVLCHLLLIVLGVLISFLSKTSTIFMVLHVVYTYIISLYMLIAILPAVALAVKRMHDIGKSGWWLLIGLIPLVGWIFTLIWACKDSEKDANKYGESPKYF